MSAQLYDRAPVIELEGRPLRDALRIVIRSCPCVGGCLACEEARRRLERSLDLAARGVTS